MFNNLVSQQFSMESIQISQSGQVPSNLESPTDVGLMRPGVDDPAMHQMPIQSSQMGVIGADSSDMISQHVLVSNYQAPLLEPVVDNHISQNLTMSNVQSFGSHPREMESMLKLQQASTLTKRKAPMESLFTNSASQNLSMPNKRVVQAEHRPWLQQISPLVKSAFPAQSFSNATGSPRTPASSKRSQSTIVSQQPQAVASKRPPGKTGPQQVPVQRNQARQMVASLRGQSESFDSVRSKLRESLASALSLVAQSKDNTSSSVGKSSKSKQSVEKSHSPGQTSVSANVNDSVHGEPKGDLPAKEDTSTQKLGDGQSGSHRVSNSADDSKMALKSDGQEFQSVITLSDDDVSFSDSLFVKDELLQGNGLSWVLESDVGQAAKDDVEAQATQEQCSQEDSHGHGGGQSFETPESLASKIEAELFKLFGGVNKKYKEKGRSLLFNLKDRNNPELGERVMSGEIPPERLCPMTAEDLASKELSEWRIAKAEELAQMVVLPDSQVDIRRLVKKTHKGEVQVEIEEPDAISADVTAGTSLLLKEKGNDADENPKPQGQQASEPSEVNVTKVESNAANGKTNLVNQDIPCTLTIPSNEGTDLMQGLMVDDELKDAEFLPPIVSLDEFMESLNSEPPFEDLPGDADGRTPISDGDNEEAGRESKTLDAPPDTSIDATSAKSHDVGMTEIKPDADEKPIYSPVKSVATHLGELKSEHVWDGLLQLNISAMPPVVGTFKSGEKTSTKDWPSLIEVKGRVRLDAFGKFLQELPMSRSRAVMAVHFACKDGSAEKDVHEVADSYLLDGRVGFAEPSPGMELYVCPPHGKTREMLSNVLPKDQVDTLNPIDNGLIGVVVWRKVTSSATHHHKHNSKKQHHVTSRRHHEKDTKANVSLTPKHPSSLGGLAVNPKPPSPPEEDEDEDNDDDDVPPGFGPLASRDEDDLPEFNFSSGSTMSRPQGLGQNSARVPPFDPHSQSVPRRPVDQIRQLIHRYGQPENTTKPLHNWQERRGSGVAVQPWNDNDDDDDDMPEWRPENSQRQYPSLQQPYVQQQLLGPHVARQGEQQQMLPAQALPVPLPEAGQLFGAPPGYGVAQQGTLWRRNAPESRGF